MSLYPTPGPDEALLVYNDERTARIIRTDARDTQNSQVIAMTPAIRRVLAGRPYVRAQVRVDGTVRLPYGVPSECAA